MLPQLASNSHARASSGCSLVQGDRRSTASGNRRCVSSHRVGLETRPTDGGAPSPSRMEATSAPVALRGKIRRRRATALRGRGEAGDRSQVTGDRNGGWRRNADGGTRGTQNTEWRQRLDGVPTGRLPPRGHLEPVQQAGCPALPGTTADGGRQERDGRRRERDGGRQETGEERRKMHGGTRGTQNTE